MIDKDWALGLRKKPFTLLALGDFSGPDSEPTVSTIDKNRFAEVLAAHGGRICVEIDHGWGQTGDRLILDTKLVDKKQLDPAVLAKDLPAVAALDRLISAVTAFTTGYGSLDAADQARRNLPADRDLDQALILLKQNPDAAAPSAPPMEKPEAAPKDPDDDPLDRLLDMVDSPAAPQPSAPPSPRDWVSSVAKSVTTGSRRPKGQIHTEPLAILEAKRDELIDAVASHPEIEKRLTQWLGLKWLIDRADFRGPLRLWLVSAPQDRWPDALRELVLAAGADEEMTSLPGLIVTGWEMANRGADLDFARALAGIAEDLQAPLLASVGGSFLGCNNAEAMESMGFAGQIIDDAAYQGFRALRDKPEARWLSLSVNRFAIDIGARSFLVSPAWALAERIAAAIARDDWPCNIAGPQHGLIEDMALLDGRPVEARLDKQTADDLAGCGIAALLPRGQSDRALFPQVPILEKPPHFGMQNATFEARKRASLGYQLFAARVARWAGDVVHHYEKGVDPAPLSDLLEMIFDAYIADTGSGYAVQVGRDADDKTLITLQVTLGATILDGGATVELAFRAA